VTPRPAAPSIALFTACALATGTAFGAGVDGPAVIAWYPRYNEGIPNLGLAGPDCLNTFTRMPAGRQDRCEQPMLTSLGTGRFQITVDNGAPFPEIADDSGSLVFVTAIASNAHCFEESATVTGTTIDSVFRCVDPEGIDIDTDFSWSYRADSLEYPMAVAYTPNFAYARVQPDGSLVGAESFSPVGLRDDDVLVEKNAGAGDYTVTFKDLNPLDANLEPMLSPYNVLVQKTCKGDATGGADPDGCFRTVCAPVSWTPGDFTTWDTTVNVRCTGADGSPRDTGFRVFFGDEGFNSQAREEGGYHHGWANWSIEASETGCHTPPEIPSNSQHELPPVYPGLPVEACHESLGTYQVNFLESTFSPYSIDGSNFVVSSRATDGTHCNVGGLTCPEAHGACGRPDTTPTTRVVITCFDPSGNPADAQWTMNMTY